MKRIRLWWIGALLALTPALVFGAVGGSRNGAALSLVNGANSCGRADLGDGTAGAPQLRGLTCDDVGKIFAFDWDVPHGETFSTIDVGIGYMGQDTTNVACLDIECGCCGDATTARECANPAKGAATRVAVTDLGASSATKSKVVRATGVAVLNAGEDRRCVCTVTRGATGGGCTESWGATPFRPYDAIFNW